jgi:hypothetical protein
MLTIYSFGSASPAAIMRGAGARSSSSGTANGKQWAVITDWIAPDQTLVRPLVEASAAKYAQDKGITLRDCP